MHNFSWNVFLQNCCLLSPGFNFFPSCVVFLPLLLSSVGVGAGVGAVAVAALLLLQLYCSLVHNFS